MPIKSFQGERAQKVKPTPSKLVVSDIMTRQLILFNPTQTIHEVMAHLLSTEFREVPW